ncbi:hypothetical protein B6U99_07305 [Candidatus Geothermarchaeota archaeon ex4572_27]|nr:MAG: hypothetical protein B6U99_07305 [Candidatus Geothermarchaeota archaeon ex4572_27]
MVDVFIQAFNAVIALLIAALTVYMVKLFRGSRFEAGWRKLVYAMMMLAIGQQGYLWSYLGLSRLAELLTGASLALIAYAMYSLKRVWLEVTPQGMEPSS